MTAIRLWIAGDPEPQGSKVAMLIGWRPGQNHRPTVKLEESGNGERKDGTSGNARAWRNKVKVAAERALALPVAELAGVPDAFPIDGPVMLTVTFLFERPKSHLKKTGGLVKGAPRLYASSHDVGDLSKLVRAVEDALAEAGVMTDDARISELHARKLYAAVGSEAGCRLEVEALEADDARD